MSWFSFPTFYKRVNASYRKNNNDHKREIHKQIGDIKYSNPGKTFDHIKEEAMNLAIESSRSCGKDTIWDEGKDGNLEKSLRNGRGNALKAAAFHYLFICSEAYSESAKAINMSVFRDESLEEIFPKNEVDDQQADIERTNLNKSQGSEIVDGRGNSSLAEVEDAEIPPRAHEDPFWGLFEDDGSAFDERSFSCGLEDRQRSAVGTSVDAFLSLKVQPASIPEGYKFGLTRVQIEHDIRSQNDCQLKFSGQFGSFREIGENAEAVLTGPNYRKKMLVVAQNGVLNGDYEFGDMPFVTLSPEKDVYQFNLLMTVQGRDASIAKTDGSALPSNVKARIIKAMLVSELGPKDDNGWITICKYRYEIRPDMRNPFQYG